MCEFVENLYERHFARFSQVQNTFPSWEMHLASPVAMMTAGENSSEKDEKSTLEFAVPSLSFTQTPLQATIAQCCSLIFSNLLL